MKQEMCCSPWGCRESDVTERLNNSNNMQDAEFPLKSLFPWQYGSINFYFIYLFGLNFKCLHE